MSEETKENKVCPACVTIKPEQMLCRTWAIAWLLLMPLTMGFTWWHDKNASPWIFGMVVVLPFLSLLWLSSLYKYFVYVVLGRRYFFWLGANDYLHIHKWSWWCRVLDRKNFPVDVLPTSPVLEIWLGGWFRRCSIIGLHESVWKVKISGSWFSCLPKYLVLTSKDELGREHSITLTFSRSCTCRSREIDYECLAWALKMLRSKSSVLSVLYELERRRTNDEAPAVAGQVGVGA